MTHRAWVRERYDHEAAEFLIGAVDALAGRELEPSIVLLLNRARDIFHAEIAQLTVFPSQPAEKAFRTTVRHGHPDEVMVALGLGELDDVLEAETAGVIVRAGERRRSQLGDAQPTRRQRGHGGAAARRVANDRQPDGRRSPRRAHLRRARPPPLPHARDPHHGDPREQPDGALDRAPHRAPGAADPSGVPRLADRSRQPLAVRPAHRSGVAAQRRGHRERRGHLPRHRRFQGRQRHPRSRGG